ncbi:beta-galactosidase trimerization domain-containing protein [Streptomyces europaeiscabiei]|uniref:beta-galactosidase trimerization domain-containing protein n=1 Tax=Streptomyces europaeiscabiei TaxID=146819 RepID=UPI0038F5DE7B
MSPPDCGLSGYRLVVVPNLYLLKERDAERLTEFVGGGGRLLVSFFSGTRPRAGGGLQGGWPDQHLLGRTDPQHG